MTVSPNSTDADTDANPSAATGNDAVTTKQMKTGIVGSIFAAICCFTPFLVIAFGMAGVTAWLGWIDYLLFPMLFISLAVLGHAFYLKSGKIGPDPKVILMIAAASFSGALFWFKFFYAIRISLLAALLVAGYAFYLKSKKSRGEKTA